MGLKCKCNSLYRLQQLVTHARRAERGPPAKPLPPIIIQTGTSEARGKGRNFAARPRRCPPFLTAPPGPGPGRQRGRGAPPETDSRWTGGESSERAAGAPVPSRRPGAAAPRCPRANRCPLRRRCLPRRPQPHSRVCPPPP